MKKSPAMRIVGMTAWGLTSLACVNILMSMFGYNFFEFMWVQQYFGGLIVPIHYLFGIAGVISFTHFVMAVMDECGC